MLPRTPLAGVVAAVLVTSAGTLALTAGSSSGSSAHGAAGHSNARVTLPGSKPTWATAAHRVRGANGSKQVGFRVYLHNRDAAGAAAYARAVSTRSNPNYGNFLSPRQYRSRYSPTDASVARVTSWLRSQG